MDVTTSANAVNLAKKVVDREKQWIQQLRQMLIVANSPVDRTWRFKLKAFIRKDAENGFRKVIGEPIPDDIEIHILDEIAHPWLWNWKFGNNVDVAACMGQLE